MLLEFCDLTLKGWLSNIGKVDVDVLENMLNFTAHIASGMEFLHSKNVRTLWPQIQGACNAGQCNIQVKLLVYACT